MRIVILTGKQAQYSNGSNLRVNSLLKYFETLNHKVDIKQLEPRGRLFPLQYRYLATASHEEYVKNLISKYDFVVIANPSLAVLHPVIKSKANLLDVCDSLISILKFKLQNESSKNFLKSLLSSLYLQFYIRKFKTLAYVTFEDSSRDSLVNRKLSTVVIPNSVNSSLFDISPISRRSSPLVVGFVADLEYALNLIQYRFILSELLPSILEFGFAFHVYGNRPNVLSIPDGVHHRGYLPNIVDVYKEIDISLCPDFQGFGFKNKVQESLIACRPVITTPLGARGQIPNEGLIINKTSNEMKLTLKLLSNRNLLRKLSVQMQKSNRNNSNFPTITGWIDDITKMKSEI